MSRDSENRRQQESQGHGVRRIERHRADYCRIKGKRKSGPPRSSELEGDSSRGVAANRNDCEIGQQQSPQEGPLPADQRDRAYERIGDALSPVCRYVEQRASRSTTEQQRIVSLHPEELAVVSVEMRDQYVVAEGPPGQRSHRAPFTEVDEILLAEVDEVLDSSFVLQQVETYHGKVH
jgi:hypothetical protein